MKRTSLAALLAALACSLNALPAMAQGAIPMTMQQATTTQQATPAQQAPAIAQPLPAPAPATAPASTPAPAAAPAAPVAAAAEAPPAPAAPAAAPAVPAAPAAPVATSATPEGLVGAAPADKAQIVFFRPSGLGAAVSFKVREGEQELGRLGNRDYFIATVAPGKHSYVVHSEAKDELNIEVDAGETYYIQGSMSMGFFVGHPHLTLSTKAMFDSISAKLSKTTL